MYTAMLNKVDIYFAWCKDYFALPASKNVYKNFLIKCNMK